MAGTTRSSAERRGERVKISKLKRGRSGDRVERCKGYRVNDRGESLGTDGFERPVGNFDSLKRYLTTPLYVVSFESILLEKLVILVIGN